MAVGIHVTVTIHVKKMNHLCDGGGSGNTPCAQETSCPGNEIPCEGSDGCDSGCDSCKDYCDSPVVCSKGG